ncbi:MAG: carboxypeptidase-like regulatory domain-containing protein [Planctomycetota bacterium]|nr:carboxypeptidase-like regulatory domain-containing protein [Planctomycetota bacterium]
MLVRLFVLVLVAVSPGCSGEVDNGAWRGEPQVTGTVTLDGAPLANATVSFETLTESSLVARTDETGRYTLELPEDANAAVGKYAVRVRMSPVSAGEGNAVSIERVPTKYNENTELVVDIFDGENTLDFKLDSAESVPD